MARNHVRTTGMRTRPGGLVDAQPAIDRVRLLVAKGMTVADMIACSSLTGRTLHGLNNGFYVVEGSRRPIKRITQSTMDDILGIEFKLSWTPDAFRPEKFRGAREAKGLSRVVLGKLTGLCPETFQYWESGRSVPKRKANMDKALAVLGVEWEDVSGPVEAVEPDEVAAYKPTGLNDIIADYPCGVCGGIFRSRYLLATHPHNRKKESK